jgi:hypothetical protein
MTTYMIALAFLCLVYGFFWNNRPARSYPRATRQRDGNLPGRVLPDSAMGTYPDGILPRPTSKPNPNCKSHRSNNSA